MTLELLVLLVGSMGVMRTRIVTVGLLPGPGAAVHGLNRGANHTACQKKLRAGPKLGSARKFASRVL